MKNVFIIGSYPSNERRIKILKKCINNIKELNFDIILTTHLPILDKEIYDIVDYVIYDKYNVKDFLDYSINVDYNGWWATLQNFSCRVLYDNSIHLNIFRSIYNGVSLADKLGYEYFNYLEGDCIINDKKELLNIQNNMFSNNYNLWFYEYCMNDGGGDYNSYSTLLFGGIPNFFVENLKNIPISVDGWISNSTYYQNGLEIIINKELKNIKEKILSIPCESIDSMIDHLIEREYGMNNIFFYDGNNFYIFLFNEHEQTIVNMYINDDIYMDINLCEREYNIHKININDLFFK